MYIYDLLKKGVLTTLLIIPLTLSAQSDLSKDDEAKFRMNSQKYSQFLYFLNMGYLEDVDVSKMTETAIESALAKLDPHSVYITKEDLKEDNEMFEGNFEGIGIEFNVFKDTVIVVNTIPGGPSEKVGLNANDRIISVDGVSIIGKKRNEVPKILRGPKGTKITVEVLRQGEPKPLTFVIERDKIPMYSMDAAYMIADSTAYVKFNRFMATTNDEFIDAMNKMPDAKNVIFDLRGNGGGFLDQAIKISENFLKKGQLIVYTEGRSTPKSEARASVDGIFSDKKLIVLVDEESASASEIVAGAVQDWDRGLIIGRRTFGKGLVQRQIPLIDSSAVRITVARYHTPSGRVIQRPFVMGDKAKYYEQFIERYNTGELIGKDTMEKAEIPDSLKYNTLVLKRAVYGGGGITPDIFVPIDTSSYSKYWGELVRKSVISDYIMSYMDKNRKSLTKKYPNFDSFNDKFFVDDSMIDDIFNIGEKSGIVKDEKEIEKIKPLLELQIKALIAQRLWDTTEYFKVMNPSSNIISKALEVINDWGKYSNGVK